MNQKIIIAFLVCPLVFGCKNKKYESELIGHWHLSKNEIESKDYYYKLNIVNDSIAFLEDVNYHNVNVANKEKPKKNINLKHNKMLLWIDGMYEEFGFILQNNRLELSNNNGKMKLHGIKHEFRNCNKSLDFFSSQLVTINLSKVETNDDLISINDYSNALQINFGIGKESKIEKIEFNRKITDRSNIELAFEKFKTTVQIEKLDDLKLVLSIDQNYNIEKVNDFLKLLDLTEFRTIAERRIDINENIVLVNYKLN